MITVIDFFVLLLFCIPIIFSKLKRKEKSMIFQQILILELWGIGDLAMMSAVLKPLKEKYPNSKITLLSKAYGKDLFGESGYIRKFVEFNFPWARFKDKYKICDWDWRGLLAVITGLRKEKFDLILDARGDIRNNLLSFLIGGKQRIGYDWTGGGYFLTDVLSVEYKKKHRVASWINILNYLNIKTQNAGPYFYVSNEIRKDVDLCLRRYNYIDNTKLLIGIHPGAAVKNRCWSLDKFARVADYVRNKYDAQIVVFIEPEGYGNNIPIKSDFIKVKPSLGELVAFIKKLNLLICNDSAAMHIAAAVDTNVLAIFGPGDVEKIGPYTAKRDIIMKYIKCRPCFDDCQYNKAFCLETIQLEDVLRVVDRIIKNKLNLVENYNLQ